MIGKRRSKYWVRVYAGRGQVRWVGTFPTWREARAAEREAEATARLPKPEATCDSFAATWMEKYPRPAPGTARAYNSAAKRFAKEFEGVKLAEVDRLRAREWALDAPASVVAAVRAMFTDAANDGLIPTNPFRGLRLRRSRGRKDITPLTETELEELADLARQRSEWGAGVFAPLILVAGYTGMREGELCVLEWGDLDLVRYEIHVLRALDRTAHVGPPKNGKARRITCPPRAREALLSVPRTLNSELIFHGPRGGRLSASVVNYHFRQLREAYGRPKLTFHELRHACATMFLERGMSAEDIGRLQLGHSSGRLVDDLYGHPSEDAARGRLKAAWAKVEPLSVARESQRRAEAQ